MTNLRKMSTSYVDLEAQDKILTEMSVSLDRLGMMAKDIGSELRNHKDDLNNLDIEVDSAQSGIGIASKRVNDILHDDGSNIKLCCIFILAVIVVALMIVVLKF